MKTFIFTVIFLLAFKLMAVSQNDNSGVYVTAEDFKNNKLLLSFECNQADSWIKIGNRFVTVNNKKQKTKVLKSEVFGVRTCKNTYRIQKGVEYKIVNKDYITLYTRSMDMGSEGAYYEDLFFFSAKFDSEILPLEKANLKREFKDNTKFISIMDSSFKHNKDLSEFSLSLSKYMIVFFFEESLK